ncbi:MAG: hypothetical protein GY725_00935 [bacterium]|nr:hypothetical protein [bacterium]
MSDDLVDGRTHVLPLGFGAFFLLGVGLVLIGSHQTALAQALDLDLARSGLLAASLTLGLGLGLLGAGPLVDRRPLKPLFLIAASIAGLPLLGIDADSSFVSVWISLALLGLGLGVLETLINSVLGRRGGTSSLRSLILVHSSATVGAVLAPAVFGWIGSHQHWSSGFRATGLAFLLLGFAALFARFPAPGARAISSTQVTRAQNMLKIWPYALMCAAYVGAETALTLFAVPYASTGLALEEGRGLASISSLWLGLLAGRLALLVLRGLPDARTLMGSGSAGALLIGLAIVFRVPWLEALYGVIGFCLGGVFPLIMSLTVQRFPEKPGLASGIVAGAGAFGGLVIPWFAGGLGDLVGVHWVLGTVAFWCFVLAGAAWVTLRSTQQATPRGNRAKGENVEQP